MPKIGDITYEKDILESVSKSLPEFFPETIKGVWKFLKKEITRHCNNDEIMAIRFPGVGTMYRSLHVINAQIKELEYIQKYRKKDVKKKLAKLRKIHKSLYGVVGEENSFHRYRENFNDDYLRKGMKSNLEIEQFQNKDE